VPASCSGATAAHAFDLSKWNLDSVSVQGVVPWNIRCRFCKVAGASEIIAIGGTDDRLKVCQSFGAGLTLNRHRHSQKERRNRDGDHPWSRVDVAFRKCPETERSERNISLVQNESTCISAGFGEPHGTMRPRLLP
jgi:D-arabinose 1-dehydrogenase-like Zn-dependent alcohol dehydrogenase